MTEDRLMELIDLCNRETGVLNEHSKKANNIRDDFFRAARKHMPELIAELRRLRDEAKAFRTACTKEILIGAGFTAQYMARGAVIHAIAKCQTCDWSHDNYKTTESAATAHNYATGHPITVELGYYRLEPRRAEAGEK